MRRVIIFAAAMLIFPILSAAAAENALVIEVSGPSQGYTDLDLGKKITYILSGVNDYDIVRPECIAQYLPEDCGINPRAAECTYKLPPSLACRYKAQYLIFVKVLHADSYISSCTVLPFIFKAHKRKYKLETELRIIDSRRGEIIKKKKYEEMRNSSRALSYLDLDATNEPALYSGYPQEMRIFSELEDIIAHKIAEEVIRTTSGK